MRTERLHAPAGVSVAAALLRGGRLVAFGTETVYGLGARADDPAAVCAIYVAKGRPAYNPLICHYPHAAAAAVDAAMTPLAQAVAAAFWPGPLTLVLPRRATSRICPAAAGNLPTLAVRVPNHPVALSLLAQVGVPIAAPSANRSGRISPTCAAHVLAELDGRIDAVLDCGPCAVGLESTVLDLTGPTPVLLREGGIPRAALQPVTGPLRDASAGAIRSPGQLLSHYAPALPLRLAATHLQPGEALLAFGPSAPAPLRYQLSQAASLAEAATRLYDGLRTLDEAAPRQGLHAIAVMPIPHADLGAAINDRLARAARRD